MMGCVVSTPPARRQLNRVKLFHLNLVVVEALAVKKECSQINSKVLPYLPATTTSEVVQ